MISNDKLLIRKRNQYLNHGKEKEHLKINKNDRISKKIQSDKTEGNTRQRMC